MKTQKRLVSIIMNCFNGEKYLSEALKSILDQTYQNWELIFFDNYSTDKSREIFETFNEPRFKYFKSKNKIDLGAARLSAYEKCNGELIAFLDVDDLWFSQKLEKQVTKFQDKNIGLVICNTLLFNDNEEVVLYEKPPPSGYVFDHVICNYFVSLETLVIRKDFIDQLDYSFDPKYNIIHDLDLVSRLSKISRLAYVDEILAKWRVHEKGQSWKNLENTNIEKRMFIENFGKNEHSNQNKLKKKFLENLNKDEVKTLLINNKRYEAIKLAIKNFQFSINNFIILLYVLSPYSDLVHKKLSRFRKLYPKSK